MNTRSSGRVLCALVLASIAAYPAVLAEDGGRPLAVGLTGDQDPNGGDLDGSGAAVLFFNPGLQQAGHLPVQDLGPAIAAHIHRAPDPMRP